MWAPSLNDLAVDVTVNTNKQPNLWYVMIHFGQIKENGSECTVTRCMPFPGPEVGLFDGLGDVGVFHDALIQVRRAAFGNSNQVEVRQAA